MTERAKGKRLHLAGLAWVLVACATSPPATNLVVEPVRLSGTAGLAPRFQPQFEALQRALEAHEDEVARQIARSLRLRLEVEGAQGGEAARDARALLGGMERILHGRALVDALELELVVREHDGPSVELFLRARTERRTRLVLRAGAALLRVHRVTLSPSEGGQEGFVVRTHAVGHLDRLELDSDGWLEVSLGSFPTLLPGNALAARTHWSLHFRAAEIEEEGRSYPAMDVPPAVVERVDLAPFLPTATVDPSELASYAARPDGSQLALYERTVRMDPARREEALDLLTPLVAGCTAEQLARLVPTLRWLAGIGQGGGDPELWRAWLATRAVERSAPPGGRSAASELDWSDDR